MRFSHFHSQQLHSNLIPYALRRLLQLADKYGILACFRSLRLKCNESDDVSLSLKSKLLVDDERTPIRGDRTRPWVMVLMLNANTSGAPDNLPLGPRENGPDLSLKYSEIQEIMKPHC